MVKVSDFGFSVIDYQIMERTPMYVVTRIWVTTYNSRTDYYEKKDYKRGIIFVFDVIMESGKYGVTVIQRSHFHTAFGIHILGSLFGSFPAEVSVLNLADTKVADVDAGLAITSPVYPYAVMFRKNDNKVVGIGTNNTGELVTDDDTQNAFVSNIGIDQITDFNGETTVFSVFANSYYMSDGTTKFTLFIEAEDTSLTGTGVSDVSGDYSGGTKKSITGDLKWAVGDLKKGTYVVIARVHQNAGSDTFDLYVNVNTAKVESYAYNIANSSSYSLGHTSFADIPLHFTVPRDGDTVEIVLDALSGTIYADYFILLPVSNGRNFIHDIYEQQLSINNNKFIGML